MSSLEMNVSNGVDERAEGMEKQVILDEDSSGELGLLGFAGSDFFETGTNEREDNQPIETVLKGKEKSFSEPSCSTSNDSEILSVMGKMFEEMQKKLSLDNQRMFKEIDKKLNESRLDNREMQKKLEETKLEIKREILETKQTLNNQLEGTKLYLR